MTPTTSMFAAMHPTRRNTDVLWRSRLMRLLRHTCIAALVTVSIANAQEVEKAVSPHADWKNLASGKSAMFVTPPNYAETTDANDAQQLFDGQVTTKAPTWYDTATVGWRGPQPIEFTVDLGGISPIRGVALRVGAGQSGVGWPKSVRVLVSDTGEAYSDVGDVMKVTPHALPAEGYDVLWLEASGLKTHGKFVKFVMTPTDTGNGIYFFADEVEIYRGDDAFLALPLPEPVAPASKDSPRADWANLARGKAVTFNTAPNDPGTNDPDDAKQMVDGALSPANPLWSDKSAVGWGMVDPTVFTVDLGADKPIRGVALHLGSGQAGVEWPASIQMYVSETGAQFSPVGDLMQMLDKRPPEKEYAAFWLVADKLETHARYVKFSCTPTNLGNGAYIFADEIEIYRGDDALLKRPLNSIESPDRWIASWNDLNWRDETQSAPEPERPTRIVLVNGKTETGGDVPLQQAMVEPSGISFTLKGEAGKSRSMSWTARLAKPVSTEKCRYALLTFRAEGVQRTYESRPLVMLQGINAKTDDNSATLIESKMVPNDGRSHTIVKRLPDGLTMNMLKVALVTEDDVPRLTLERLELLAEVPDVFTPEVAIGSAALIPGFAPVELGAALNGTISAWYEEAFEKHKLIMDGVRTLNTGSVTVSGVPFTIAAGANNLAAMPQSVPSTERIEFLGHQMDRRYLEPDSRHDALTVNVDANAREAFLLLALSASPTQVLGGQPHTALHLDDVESLSIELTYDSGEPDIALPYSLADKGCYIPARAIGAYAVAVDPTRRLKTITLHNRHYGPNFALVGLTLNTSDKPLVPEIADPGAPEQTRQNPEPAAKPVVVAHEGSRLTISNRWYEYSFDLTKGFIIDRAANRWNDAAKLSLGSSSGLRLRVGDTVYTGACFKAEVVRTNVTTAELKLTSTRPELPLELAVTVTADESPNLSFVTKSTNTGDKPLAAELALPALDGVVIGDVEQTRIFFPQYRNVDTAERIALRAPYGPEYTSQFMDVYSRVAGVGLMVRTDNTEQQMVHFALRKDDTGVSGGAHFPADYNQLAPGASHTYVPVSLIAHGGDWRTGVTMHRDWVRSWYKPYKFQEKAYFKDAWEIACYRTSDYLSWLEQKAAPFINKERNKFMVDEIFAFEKKNRGHEPDLVHFYNWTYDDENKRNDYGTHGSPRAYAHVGGLEFFRKGIDDIQTRLNKPLSLYTVVDRFRASALPDQNLANELIASSWYQQPDSDASSIVRGASTLKDGIYYVQCGDKKWTEYLVNDIVQMQRDTGCKMVYMDVFSFWSHLKGAKGTSPRQADLKLLKMLRDRLPADVAVWSEYPPTDYGQQFSDGALQYYFLHLNEVFARRYNFAARSYDMLHEMPINIGRYVLPSFKSFGLPGYIEASNSPTQVDAMFVNGEGIQEDTWRLHHSRIRRKLNRAYDVKRAYTDCFNTSSPQPMVDTAAKGIVANCFPTENRTLWTLYNVRPKTYTGIVLEVPHKPGARYRDAWNDKELTPVIENGIAKIAITIHPQQPGCVVQDITN